MVEHSAVNRRVVGSSPTGGAMWPVGQAVKTPPFHGGIGGSIPPPVTKYGRLAQLGERLPYKQNVSGSIPLAPTIFLPILPQYCNGPVVQLVRMPPCHGGGRGFESHPGRHYASVAQLVEQRTENPCVHSSILC